MSELLRFAARVQWAVLLCAAAACGGARNPSPASGAKPSSTEARFSPGRPVACTPSSPKEDAYTHPSIREWRSLFRRMGGALRGSVPLPRRTGEPQRYLVHSLEPKEVSVLLEEDSRGTVIAHSTVGLEIRSVSIDGRWALLHDYGDPRDETILVELLTQKKWRLPYPDAVLLDAGRFVAADPALGMIEADTSAGTYLILSKDEKRPLAASPSGRWLAAKRAMDGDDADMAYYRYDRASCIFDQQIPVDLSDFKIRKAIGGDDGSFLLLNNGVAWREASGKWRWGFTSQGEVVDRDGSALVVLAGGIQHGRILQRPENDILVAIDDVPGASFKDYRTAWREAEERAGARDTELRGDQERERGQERQRQQEQQRRSEAPKRAGYFCHFNRMDSWSSCTAGSAPNAEAGCRKTAHEYGGHCENQESVWCFRTPLGWEGNCSATEAHCLAAPLRGGNPCSPRTQP